MKEPNVEHLFPVPPAKALKQWAVDRLKTVGSSGSARFSILDARALETPLMMKKGFVSSFKNQQSHQYDLFIKAMVEILDDGGKRLGFATASARRSTTVVEGATLNQREVLWHAMTEKLMNAFNASLEKNIHTHLKRWVK